MEKIMHFLQDLKANNNREWFNANRARYEQCRDKMFFITEILIHEIGRFDSDIAVMDPKSCMFRIFRDIRFSKDKHPYKTNFGTFIARGGRKSEYAGYYLHIEPGASFAGGGVYRPSSEPLKAIRQHIAQDPEEFIRITTDKQFNKYFPDMYDHQLKTAPKGFPKDHKYIDLLRYKSYIFSTPLSDDLLMNGDFVDYIAKAFRQLYRINSFLNEALRGSKEKA